MNTRTKNIEKVIQAECEKIQPENGFILAQDLVEISKDVNAPLHNHFEWDDTKAGQEWRVHQARNLIDKVMVEINGQTTHYYAEVELKGK